MGKYIQGICVAIASILLLAGCGAISDEELVEKSKEAMEEKESIVIDFTEKERNITSKGTTYLMDEGTQFRIDYDEADVALYGKKDLILIKDETGYVQDITSNRDNMNIDSIIELFSNPLKKLEKMDKKLLEHIEVEKTDDEFEIKYVGEEDVLFDMGKEYLKVTLSEQEHREFDEMEVDKFTLKVTVDAESYEVNEAHIKISYEENGQANNMNHKYTYKEYDGLDEIEALEVSEGTGENGGIHDTVGIGSGAELDDEVVKGAGEYVEALIYATVYQDEKAFIKSAPDSMEEKEAKEHAILQKETFREIYIGNTKNNMAGLDVSDEQIESLTDAFLEALSKAEFEVLTSTATGSDNVVVTVSVNGISDMDVYKEVEKKLKEEVAKAENLSEQELIAMEFDILIEEYKNVKVLEEAVEVPVNVMVQGGSYTVLMQDEYLMAFVQ